MSRLTQDTPSSTSTFRYGALTLFGRLSQVVPLVFASHIGVLQPQTVNCLVWASPRSLAATYGVSIDFLSWGYLDVSVPPVRLTCLCIQHVMMGHDAHRVFPFGHLRVEACFQLAAAFRR